MFIFHFLGLRKLLHFKTARGGELIPLTPPINVPLIVLSISLMKLNLFDKILYYIIICKN